MTEVEKATASLATANRCMKGKHNASSACRLQEAGHGCRRRARARKYLLTELDVVHQLLATLLALCFDQDQGLVSLLHVSHRG